MEFIQEKTVDPAVEHFLHKAAGQEIGLVWDRFEAQIPECGFCENGLSCRDCLQGPCISHPFKDQSREGVCGKNRDILAMQSLLRLTIKGTMGILSQLTDFAHGVETGRLTPRTQKKADSILKDTQGLFKRNGLKIPREFPAAVVKPWRAVGVLPEGIARDLFKASQSLEGGICGMQEILAWAFKCALLGCFAERLQSKLREAVFGQMAPEKLELNLGVLRTDRPNILLYGYVSPLLKYKIAEKAQERGVGVAGVCTDPFLPPYRFAPVTSFGSQEIPLMTGAVDLIVAGDQFVNPSLSAIARNWKVTLVAADSINGEPDVDAFAQQIVDRAMKGFDNRGDVPRDVPDIKETAVMGFSAESVDADRIATALTSGKIRGIALLGGSNNVKYTQDNTLATMAQHFLASDILCVSHGEASVSLAKYGFLNPQRRSDFCGKGVAQALTSLGRSIPPVLDWNTTDFLQALVGRVKTPLKDYPILAWFPEAHRSLEVTQALWTAAMGVSTYFWPCLPVTGSPNAKKALGEFCSQHFGSELYVITEKMDHLAKAELFSRALKQTESLSGKPW